VPKGVALGHNGLDLRLWGSNPRYPSFVSPDYPLWWSSLTGLDLRFVGSVDLRAVDAQLAILLVAFVGAVARLLWGLVRPWILWPGLLLVLASPELLRQAHGGGADIPVAIYVVLLAVGGGVWLARGDGLALITAFASAAAALAIKNEGLPEALLVVVVLSLAGLRAGRTRLAWLWAAFGGGLALAAPWFVWRQMHGIAADVSFSRSFDVGYLLDRTDRIRPTLDTLQTDLFSARSWLVAVPFAIALAALCVARLRRPLYVAPVALLVLLFALLVWVYWADSLDLGYRLRTSGYRTVDVLTLLAGVSALVLAEALVRGGRGRSPRPGRRAAAKA